MEDNSCGCSRIECRGDFKSGPVTGYGIHIFESSYGLPGRVIQVTGLIAARCEGRYRCAFPVRNGFFGADPIIGPRKQVVVYWTCGGGRNRSVFPEYTEASLSC